MCAHASTFQDSALPYREEILLPRTMAIARLMIGSLAMSSGHREDKECRKRNDLHHPTYHSLPLRPPLLMRSRRNAPRILSPFLHKHDRVLRVQVPSAT